MLKKIISISLIITMILSFTTVVFAEGFSDVDEAKYSWAVTQINDMAEKGIINGYPDGTFQPANGITKIEAMLLISRILGINNDVYSDSLDDIYSVYEEELDKLNLQYEKEIAFLIYKGVFALGEIEEMADELKKPLLRYEAAEYLTKVMDANADLSDNETGFSDESSIPASYRAYVKYVKVNGIMQGMTETTFDPSFQVNRAQMAVMLHRVMDKKELLFMEGTYEGIVGKQINVKLSSGTGSYDVSEADFYKNDEICENDDIVIGNKVILVFENATLKRVETVYIAPEVSKTVVGQIKELVLTSVKTVKIENSATDEAEIYSVSPECEVYVDGNISTLSVLRTKDNSRLYINSENIVVRIDVLDASFDFADGVIKEISYDGSRIDILRKDGTMETYYVSDDIVVTRNSKESTLSNLLPGDEVKSCIVRYNKIDKLSVKSEIGSSSGTITELVISKQSSIVVTKNGVPTRYPITNSLKVSLDGKECEIYDLRLDMVAEITTDSGAVSEINVTSVEEVGQISGVVENVNVKRGFIEVKTSDNSLKQVFVTTSTNITQDGAVTAKKTIENIHEGDYVVVVGKSVNGAFDATTIVIVD
ncbi:MAG: S-layer homology domain-containing protein [Ruminococcaceae bacterium]|nr:S-layer homology domain-containing protein [Oscillospiraceae bacterium]